MGWERMETRAEAIRGLLNLVGLKRLWEKEGPTPEAVKLRDSEALPEGAAILLRICFDLWDGSARVSLADAPKLEPWVLHALCELLQAINDGPSLVVDWCDGAITLKLRALAWSGDFKDPLGNEDAFAEQALLFAAEVIEAQIEGVMPATREAS